MKNLYLLFAALTLAVSAGCGGGSSSAKIGLNIELTGEMPAVGASAKNAAEMFVNEINKAGGLDVAGKKQPLTLVIGDNAAKADQAAAVRRRVLAEAAGAGRVHQTLGEPPLEHDRRVAGRVGAKGDA